MATSDFKYLAKIIGAGLLNAFEVEEPTARSVIEAMKKAING
jgi:hypothetical protein